MINKNVILDAKKPYGNLYAESELTRTFRTPACSLCGKEMQLVEGDTIFGDKWFHNNCWKMFSKKEECLA